MPRTAATERRTADLATDFGLATATRWFGEEAIASLPVRANGKNKGKPKGVLVWLRTTEAGYHPNAGGGVGPDTVVRAWIGGSGWASEGEALTGRWLGRDQTLCASKCLLGPAARARHTAEAARFAAEDEARWEELKRDGRA